VSPLENWVYHFGVSPIQVAPGEWEAVGRVTIPRYVEGGLWRVVNLTAVDSSGNNVTYMDDDDFNGVNNKVLSVNSVPDYLPPQLNSITFDPSSKMLNILSFIW
jgi:hypothetical protein